MKIFTYTLLGKEIREDWSDIENNFPYKEFDVEIDCAVVDDPSATICIGGKDINGIYRQFDTSEAWDAWSYFESNPEWKLKIVTKTYEIPDSVLSQFEIK